MLKNLVVLLRYLLFWIVLFALERTVFVVYNWQKLKGLSFYDSLKLYTYGAWMDLSAAGYLCALPLLVFVVLWIGRVKWFPVIIARIYTWFMVILCAIITVVNFNIYREWGTKINYRVLEFTFGSPGEAMASTGSSPWGLTLLFFAFLLIAAALLMKYMLVFKQDMKDGLVIRIVASLLLVGLNFLAIRGGWQLSPMNESMAYFAQSPLVNHTAVNTEWSLLHDAIYAQNNHANPYKFFKRQEADSIVRTVYQKRAGNTVEVLTTKRPNIMLIIMESQTANVIEHLHGEKGVDPAMEALIKEGIFFNNAYAAASRTDRGVVAVLSAFPAQGKRSIMKESEKQAKLPALSQDFARQGYATSFYYGGESQFANMKAYLLNHEFERIVDKADFDAKDMNSKWGAYDAVVYKRVINDMNKETKPFFTTMLTLTNHEPFELPGKPRFPGDDVYNKFRSTAFYADSCLGDFITKARHAPWYKNTLFIVVADHGHRLPVADLQIYDPQHFRLPLLFFGDVIRPEFRGKVIDKVANQTDIACTLLTQLALPVGQYPWSKDLLNPETTEYSFFNWEDGFGAVSKDQIVTYGMGEKQVIYRQKKESFSETELLKKAKASMQSVYQQYIDY